ncbi:LysM peptidoglycan-binding domain-containing protein [Treponema rectale]|uniref:LysM peptidoglycan-binding domain-containing protein n=1 Tax=Treponema rectale TaxID=744512 RepID=A0A840SB49_9SPIR|nr:membrane-bound lytic murein transglycosylase D [Treponema rectale]QOS41111.1 LysM peptidoglycan-binding domain-containing protein [Treponema rectale]
MVHKKEAFLLSILAFTQIKLFSQNLEPVLEEELPPLQEMVEDLTQTLQKAAEVLPEQKQEAEPDEEYTKIYTVVPEAKRYSVGLSGMNHSLTKKFRTQYLKDTGKAQLTAILYDSLPYRPYIRQQLKAKKMPMIIQYLPIIESNYKTTAVSRTGATGLWQFMTNSMSPFLKKNTWYDERLDPWKETDAALSKLLDNYKMFHNWELSLAAYNMGAGAMKRILKKHPGKDFWYLAEHGYLPAQTRDYVPKLIAVADVIENAEYYGVLEIGIADKAIETHAVEKYEYVTVAGMISLEQISKLTGIERSVLDFLNPSLLKKCTPAGEKYSLRVPSGTSEKAAEALKKADIATDALIYIVKKGDSLWSISRSYGLTVDDLCRANNIKEISILRINQKLVIPVFK